MVEDRDRSLWEEIDRFAFWVSALIIGVLIIVYYQISRTPSNEGTFWNILRTLSLDVLANLLPVLLVFSISYVLFRRIQALRSERDTEAVATKVASTISEKLVRIPILRNRKYLPSFESQTRTANEINVVAVSGTTLFFSNLGAFEKRIKEGCKLRVILLNPGSNALEAWEMISKTPTTASDIDSVLQILKGLMQLESAEGTCEVRLSEALLPFSMVAVDMERETGEMVVEYHTYRTALEVRPHFHLTAHESQDWFRFYVQQFEQIWSESSLWKQEG